MTGRAVLVPQAGRGPGPADGQDRRGGAVEAPAGTLWVVRHGQSGWNVADRIQGQSPRAPGLTGTGRAQAAGAARALAARAPGATLIVASDLARAAETAGIIAGLLGLPLQFDRELREQSLGDLEGGPAFAPARTDGAAEDVLDVFWHDPFREPPGGESVAGMYERVQRALHRIAAARPGAGLIIVTHGGPVRVATATAPPARGRAFPRPPVGNASVTPWPAPSAQGAARARSGTLPPPR